jgi:hypothetical protein
MKKCYNDKMTFAVILNGSKTYKKELYHAVENSKDYKEYEQAEYEKSCKKFEEVVYGYSKGI